MLTEIHRHKHSAYTSTFPIYLWEQWTEEVPEETPAEVTPDVTEAETAEEPTPAKEAETETAAETSETPAAEADEDEAVVEEVTKEEEKTEPPPPKMVQVEKQQWSRLNQQTPLWARDPKNITDGARPLLEA